MNLCCCKNYDSENLSAFRFGFMNPLSKLLFNIRVINRFLSRWICGRQSFNELPFWLVLVLIAMIGLCSGCVMLKNVIGFQEQVKMAKAKGRVEGNIDVKGGATGTLVVVIGIPQTGEGGKPLVLDSYVRGRTGSYAFAVDPGQYVVGAYEDRNENHLLDPGELVKRLTLSREFVVASGEVVTEDILLTQADAATKLSKSIDVFDIIERTPSEQSRFSLWKLSVKGQVCEDLNSDKFNQAAGTQGLWQSMDFVNKGMSGIYFLEEYDEDRIPVLFVHGISGYPQQFRTILANLDREQFQPWFYYYPSGFRLDSISNHLAVLLERMQIKHKFDKIAIVAHSMGGLVSRSAILKYQKETHRRDIRLLVSISTPWDGDIKARRASNASIELPPSFGDMDPASDYLRAIFWKDVDKNRSNEFSPETQFHMIFGFRMRKSKPVADDGVVNVSSQVRQEARDRAVSRWPYDLDHEEILHGKAVINRINIILNEHF
jgi:pimeloyl-ACP methyl ester carboxylesterase